MKNLTKWASIALFLILTACSSSSSSLRAPRLTTEGERAEASETLRLIETGAVAAHVAGKLKPGDLNLIIRQLGELEQVVQRSETEPVSWRSIARQIAVLAAAWAVREQQKNQPPAGS